MPQTITGNIQSSVPRIPAAIKVLLAVNIFLGCCNLALTTPLPDRYDEAGYMSWAQAIIVDGNFDPTPHIPWNENHPLMQINGRRVCVVTFPIGWSVAAFPFIALGQGICHASNTLFQTHYLLNGADAPVVRLAWLGVVLWSTLGLLATYSAVARFVPAGPAALATILAWLGTSAWAYTWKSPGMSHGVSLAFVAFTYWWALRAAETGYARRYLLCFGLCAGMVVCCRILNAILLIPAGLLLIGGWPLPRRDAGIRSVEAPKILLYSIAGFAPLMLLQMFVWKSVYGQLLFNGYAVKNEGFAINFRNLAKLLLSSDHGLFFYHPVTLIAFYGLIRYARRGSPTSFCRAFALACLGSLGATIVLYGFWHYWDLGDSYGARWAADCFLFWALGIAIVVAGWKGRAIGRRAALVALVLPSILLISGQMAGWIAMAGRLQIYLPGHRWYLLH